MTTPIIGDIIKSIDKRKDRISNALGGLASSQAQIAQGFGGSSGFAPTQTQIQPLQTSFTGDLSNHSLANIFKPRETAASAPQGYGAIGQAISQQAPSANTNLYEYLMR